jgi:hypothetical protein
LETILKWKLNMGGSIGDAAKNIQRQNEARNENARQYKREKLDEQTRAAQHNAGQATGHLMGEFEAGAAELMDFGERNTRSLRSQSQSDTPEVSDTQSANYSKSSSEKSSKSSSKAKKKGGEGTGGSKAQFYAKK